MRHVSQFSTLIRVNLQSDVLAGKSSLGGPLHYRRSSGDEKRQIEARQLCGRKQMRTLSHVRMVRKAYHVEVVRRLFCAVKATALFIGLFLPRLFFELAIDWIRARTWTHSTQRASAY